MGRINLGDRVRSKVDGFEGIAEARIECLGASPQIRVAGPTRDGKEGTRYWCDQSVLDVIHPAAVTV